MTTLEQAKAQAEFLSQVLYEDGDPFDGLVDKDTLVKEVEFATLKKLVQEDSDILTEPEFNECIQKAKLKSI